MTRNTLLFERSFDDSRNGFIGVPDGFLGRAGEEELTAEGITLLVEQSMLELPVVQRDEIEFRTKTVDGDKIAVTMLVPTSGSTDLLAVRPPSTAAPSQAPGIQLTDDVFGGVDADPEGRPARSGFRHTMWVGASATAEEIKKSAREFIAEVDEGIAALEPVVAEYNRNVNLRMREQAKTRLQALRGSQDLGKSLGRGLD